VSGAGDGPCPEAAARHEHVSPLGRAAHVYAADSRRRQKIAASRAANIVWDGDNVLQGADGSLAAQAQYTDYPEYRGGLVSQRTNERLGQH